MKDTEGGNYIVVGYLPGGLSRMLWMSRTMEGAEKKAALFRLHLEGYERIAAEKVMARVPVWGSEDDGPVYGKLCRHCHKNKAMPGKRGLCYKHYMNLEVRKLYPSLSNYVTGEG